MITPQEYLLDWLFTRGVSNAPGLIQSYGLDPVLEVAVDLNRLERAGIDWRLGIRNPGAYIHSMIRERKPGGPAYKDHQSG